MTSATRVIGKTFDLVLWMLCSLSLVALSVVPVSPEKFLWCLALAVVLIIGAVLAAYDFCRD